jgi:Tfp pilus assembly protein PilF
MIAWGAAALSAKRRFGKIIFRTAAITTLAILLIGTRMQVKFWKSSFTLFEHTLKVTQNNYIVHNNYGIALSQAGRLDEGIAQFRQSLQINPQRLNTHYNLGLALAQAGHLEEAVVHLRKSLVSDSNSPSTLINLASVLVMDKNLRGNNYAEAVKLAERACKLTDYKNPQMLNILEKAKKAASSQADGNQPIK